MGFLKNLGKTLGVGAGLVTTLPIQIVGEILDSDFIREVGDTAFKITSQTGETIGNLAEGTVECASGILQSDNNKIQNGLTQVVDTTANTVVGFGRGIIKTAEKGLDTIDAIAHGDTEKAIKVGKELAKVALVSMVAISVTDMIDNIDDSFDDRDSIEDEAIRITDNTTSENLIANNDEDTVYIENLDTHHVSPHWRTLSDGRTIWIDGDGTTSVNTYDGWIQSNPDYKA